MDDGRVRSKYYIVKSIDAEFRTKTEAEKHLQNISGKFRVIRGLEKQIKVETAERVIIKTRKDQ